MSRKPWGVLAFVLAPGLACNAYNNSNYAQVPVAVGMVVAQAAIYRAATGACWAQCDLGTRCNETTGLCEPVDKFVAPAKGDPSALPPATPAPPAAADAEDETCAGYCRTDERCVVIPDGDIKCVPLASETRPH